MTVAPDRSYPGLARFEPRLDSLPEPQRALTSFEDGDLPALAEGTRQRLVAAVASVNRIPILGAYAATILPAAPRGRTPS